MFHLNFILIFLSLFLGVPETGITPEGKFFDSAGARLHYIDTGGDGEPVLLIHGFASELGDWASDGRWGARMLDALVSEGFRVIAFDNRGHGRSAAPHEVDQYGLEMVEDCRRVLDHVGVERAHVIGYSLGGAIANKFREIHPHRLHTVTLGGVGWAPEGRDWSETIASLEKGEGMPSLLRVSNPDVTEQEVQSINDVFLVGRDQLALAAVLKADRHLPVSERGLRENEVPALAIIGSDDFLMEEFRRMVAVMANVETVVIEGENHGSTFVSPLFVQHVTEFLRRNSASSR